MMTLSLLVCILVIFCGGHFSGIDGKSFDPNDGPVCQTEHCKKIAQEIMEGMDQSADPCQDFYQYACGKSNTKKTDDDNWNHIKIITNRTKYRLKEILESESLPTDNLAMIKARQLYETCMDTETIKKAGLMNVVKLIDLHGGWPMAMNEYSWKVIEKPWQDIDKSFNKIFAGSSPFYKIAVLPDVKNSTNNILWFTPPSKAAADLNSAEARSRSGLNDYLNSPAVMKYKKTISTVARLIANYRGYYVTDEQLANDAHKIVEMEIKLKQIQLVRTNGTKSDVSSAFRKITINDLQGASDVIKSKTPNGKIDWLSQTRSMFSDIPEIDINGSEVIAALPLEYFMKLAYLLDNTPTRDIVNLMQWWFLKSIAIYTTDEILSAMKASIPDHLKRPPPPRWVTCIAENQMKHTLAHAYIQKYFSEKAKKDAADMVNEIIMGMKRDIENCSWLDNYSKQGALKKLGAMREFVGFPDWYKDKNAVENSYKELKIGKSFLENELSVFQFFSAQKLRTLRTLIDKKKWSAIPTDVNAFYYYPGNSLTIPAGILQFPFFDDEQPTALNYGGIGTVIGHEISHGFDDVGRQFDHDGTVRNWWSNTTVFEFKKRAQCFINKFHRYAITYNRTIHRLNPFQTLSENIADTTGVKAVFEAFQTHAEQNYDANMKLPGLEHLNSHQLLFLSFANTFCSNTKLSSLVMQLQHDPHSPGVFRLVGTVSNIESFAKSFKCAKGTPMNPVDKCNIW